MNEINAKFCFLSINTLKFSQLWEYSEKIRTDPTLRGVLARSHYKLIYQNQRNINHDAGFKICKESIQMAHVVMITRKDFYLVDAWNHKIERLKQSGLIELWRLRFINQNFLNVKEPISPHVITTQQILGSLYILMAGYAGSMLTFVMELFFLLLVKKNLHLKFPYLCACKNRIQVD